MNFVKNIPIKNNYLYKCLYNTKTKTYNEIVMKILFWLGVLLRLRETYVLTLEPDLVNTSVGKLFY